MHIPNLQSVPLLKSKDDLKANFTISNYQLSYAFTDYLGVSTNFHLPNLDPFNSFYEDRSGNRFFAEGGFRLFTKLKELGTVDLFSGIGRGRVAFDSGSPSVMDQISTDFQRYFVQPSIGWEEGRFAFAFSIRYTHLKYFNLDISQYIFDPMSEREDLSRVDQSTYQFLEPAATFKVGDEETKLMLQIQRVNQLSNPTIRSFETMVSLGVTVLLFDDRNVVNEKKSSSEIFN